MVAWGAWTLPEVAVPRACRGAHGAR